MVNVHRQLDDMDEGDDNFWDFLSEREATFAESIMQELSEVPWAQPLLQKIREGGGLTRSNMALLFELRFGSSLYKSGATPIYEIAGEGSSTLDFGFTSGSANWRVELMRLNETQAVRDATQSSAWEDGIKWSSRILNTNAPDRRQSEEGETLKAVERICQKCEKAGRPYKFPEPDGSYHALIVDFRTLFNGGDVHDRIHVGLGGEFVIDDFLQRYWNGELIFGVFNKRNTLRGADYIRQRVHFLGFVNEKEYREGGFVDNTQFIANPFLFETAPDARSALETWPLQPARLLNGK